MKNIRIQTIIIIAYCCTVFTTHAMENFFNEIREDVGAVAGALSPTLGELIHGEPRAIINNPYKDTTALAKHNPGISNGEQAYLENRLPIIKAALEKMLNRSLHEKPVPKIALISSGGGYRAMFCTIGSLLAAEEIGLLDSTTYVTALSGSTWAIAPWISTGMPLTQFKEYVQTCAAKPFHELTHDEKILIAETIAVKKTYNQPRTAVDLYGDLLANRLLEQRGDLRQMTYLSDQAKTVESGLSPYPIYTAIDGRESVVDGQTWYEFTPHTISDRVNNIEIPTWACGRKFKKGTSKDNAPEKSLGYLMGTWGSAFAASIDDILEAIDTDKEHENLLEKIATPLKGKRPLPFWAKVANYMRNMDNINDEALAKKKNLKFVDAGLEANLPYPPVSGICPGRRADILIFLDASAGDIGGELHKAAAYAEKHKLPFPTINSDNLDKKTISIFKDENNINSPLVIYMPRISNRELWEENKLKPEFAPYNLSEFDLDYESNNGFAETKHFQYAQNDSTRIINQTKFNMCATKDTIIKEINWHIDRK